MSLDSLPAGWTLVKLGDVAVNSTAFSSSPIEDGYERYILGKDIPDGGPIETWGEVGDGHFGSRIRTRIEAGDVICTTRGPNLRVARATFRALGAHTNFVLRSANELTLLQDFLALVAESDGFQTHLERNFRGSVNLFVNWSDAARYEFALPPIEEQRQLAEVCGQSDRVVGSTQVAITRSDQMLASLVTESYRQLREHGRMVKVPEFGDLTMGRQKSPKYALGINPVPYLSVANVENLQLKLSSPASMDFSATEIVKYRLQKGDVLVTEGDIVSAANVGRSAVFEDGPDPCCFQNTLIRLRPAAGIDPYFVMAMFEGARLAGVLAAAAGTTTISHLGLKKLSGVSLPMAPAAAQSAISVRLRDAIAFRNQLRQHLETAVVAARTVRLEVGL